MATKILTGRISEILGSTGIVKSGRIVISNLKAKIA